MTPKDDLKFDAPSRDRCAGSRDAETVASGC
jgi:hypothetical protein